MIYDHQIIIFHFWREQVYLWMFFVKVLYSSRLYDRCKCLGYFNPKIIMVHVPTQSDQNINFMNIYKKDYTKITQVIG